MSENGKPKRESQSMKVRNYLIGLGAVSTLILALFANFRGEPGAEKGYARLQDMVDKQTAHIQNMDKRLHGQDMFVKGLLKALQIELPEAPEPAQKASKPKPTPAPKPRARARSAPKPTARGGGYGGGIGYGVGMGSVKVGTIKIKKCKAGYVEVEGKCLPASKSVVKSVKKHKKELAETMRRLEEERRKREMLEQRTKKLRHQQQTQQPLPLLKKLPDKLEDVKK